MELASALRNKFAQLQEPQLPSCVLSSLLPANRVMEYLPRLNLSLVGVLVLADLGLIARRTALTGTSCLLDCFILVPGLHTQTQAALELHRGEYPACANMASGYVFRVENPATVAFLQRVSRTGHLTSLAVHDGSASTWSGGVAAVVYDFHGISSLATMAYFLAALLTVAALAVTTALEDVCGCAAVALLVAARAITVFVVRRRAAPGWFGASEPGVTGDLLVLLSQDRWVRIRGPVDDLKAATSGQWMRAATATEAVLEGVATLLTYFDITLIANARRESQALILLHFCVSAALLGLANASTQCLKIHGRMVQVRGEPVKYPRRLDLTNKLIEETGRDDWAIQMGMKRDSSEGRAQKPLVM